MVGGAMAGVVALTRNTPTRPNDRGDRCPEMPLRLVTSTLATMPSALRHCVTIVLALSEQAKEVGTVKEVTPAGMSMRRGSAPGALPL
jgi:hypothetical protein